VGSISKNIHFKLCFLLLIIHLNIEGFFMQTGNSQITIFLIVTTLLIVLLVGVIVTILYIHQNRRISFQESLSNSQLEIQEETFQHLSREIHDNIGLSLTLAKLHLNTLDLNLQQRTPTTIKGCIDLISQAITDLSYISKSLNTEAIKSEGFLSALQMKLGTISKTEKFAIKFIVNGDAVFLASQTELILYRITQEALNNILKHSKATEIHISLTYTQAYLTLQIKDNGIGINWEEIEKVKSSKMSAGLNNMKKRAKMINGFCEIKSKQTGTTVLVTIPLQANEKSTSY
jgi:two-component system, NarL family, sensor kinase